MLHINTVYNKKFDDVLKESTINEKKDSQTIL